MINLRDKILKSQIAYYNGLIAKHQQNVEIYLNQPVGIGEHSDVMAAIDGEINSIAQAHEKIEIINHYFLNKDNGQVHKIQRISTFESLQCLASRLPERLQEIGNKEPFLCENLIKLMKGRYITKDKKSIVESNVE